MVMNGIETEDEALIAMDANADLVQGDCFGWPAPGPNSANREACSMMQLCVQLKRVSDKESAAQRDGGAGHPAGFAQCESAVQSGIPFGAACARFVT